MRDGKSTLNRKARREPTAKAERKLLPKNRRGVEGQEAKRPSSQPGGRYCQDQEPVSGARTPGSDGRYVHQSATGGTGASRPSILRRNAEEPHTLFRGRLPPASNIVRTRLSRSKEVIR